jgi:hypothetical protein
MSRIVIKRKISLDFIGADYKDCYLEFKTIPMKDYEKYVELAGENKDEKKAVGFITSTLQDLFISGKFIGEDDELFDVKKEELGDFDMNVMITVFKTLTGQDQNPN